MPILLFVVSMISVLSVITYSKLLSFRENALQRYELYQEMDQLEVQYLNHHQEKLYKDSRCKRGKKREKENNGREKPPLDSRFDLSYLLFDKKRREDSLKSEASLKIFQRLIEEIYRDDLYFWEKLGKENTIEDLLREVVAELDQRSIVNGKILRGIHFSKGSFKTCWEFILNGSSTYPGIDSFIKIGEVNSYKKVSIYLAKRELLYALYGDRDVVERLIRKRQEIYRDYKNKRVAEEDAKKDLSLSFGEVELEEGFVGLLDFRVSMTRPCR